MISQELINSAWVAIAKATDLMASELEQSAAEHKDGNYSEAAKLEAAASELKKASADMRTDYPHLFEGEAK